MKFISLILAVLVPCAHAMEIPPSQLPPRRWELMKCTSEKNGTIWASFGRLYKSGQNEPVWFPTEIVLFAKDFSYRELFPDYREALKVPVRVSPGSMSMTFLAKKGEIVQTNLVQLIQYDSRIPNAFLGNWNVSEPGKPDVSDLVSCSLD